MNKIKIAVAFEKALEAARYWRGHTMPNPPVGACILDENENILCVEAHQKAGNPHAEILAIKSLKKKANFSRAHTLVVTLEPCNHTGKTGPCVEAIISAGFKRIFIGVNDSSSKKSTSGFIELVKAGIDVIFLKDLEGSIFESLYVDCENLVKPFHWWSLKEMPWVTVKIALDEKGSMIPPHDAKTFTSQESLQLAHQLRRQSDAIFTGSGTVLADNPLFTVRHLEDFEGKKRWLAVFDRRGRVTNEYYDRAGVHFSILKSQDLRSALNQLGKNGALEVLVEAGPTFVDFVMQENLWNQKYIIYKNGLGIGKDKIEISYRN